MAPPKRVLSQREVDQIEELAGLGLSKEKIARVMGVSRGTLDKWLKDPDVAEYFEAGRAKAEEAVGRALMDQCRRGNIVAIQWWEKTRAGRRERIDVVTANVAEIMRAMNEASELQLRRIAAGEDPHSVLGILPGGEEE